MKPLEAVETTIASLRTPIALVLWSKRPTKMQLPWCRKTKTTTRTGLRVWVWMNGNYDVSNPLMRVNSKQLKCAKISATTRCFSSMAWSVRDSLATF